MKRFVINIDYGGQMGPCTIYIGQSEDNHHPIHFQADYLFKQKGATVPPEIMDALTELKDISIKNKVLLEDLCVYAIGPDEDTKAKNKLQNPSTNNEEENLDNSEEETVNESEDDNVFNDEETLDEDEANILSDIENDEETLDEETNKK